MNPVRKKATDTKKNSGEMPMCREQVRQRLVLLGCLALGISLGAVGLHFGVERPALETLRERAFEYRRDLAAERARISDANAAIAALEARLQVEESTRRGLETSLHTLQAELGRSKDTIAFYEQLMPPGPKGSISIRALDIEPFGPHIRYRALLMRSGSSGEPFKGTLQFLAEGLLNGEETTIELRPATIASVDDEALPENPESSESLMALEFVDFQRSSGLLGLPEGFIPRQVTMNVLEGQTLRTSRSIDLPSRE